MDHGASKRRSPQTTCDTLKGVQAASVNEAELTRESETPSTVCCEAYLVLLVPNKVIFEEQCAAAMACFQATDCKTQIPI